VGRSGVRGGGVLAEVCSSSEQLGLTGKLLRPRPAASSESMSQESSWILLEPRPFFCPASHCPGPGSLTGRRRPPDRRRADSDSALVRRDVTPGGTGRLPGPADSVTPRPPRPPPGPPGRLCGRGRPGPGLGVDPYPTRVPCHLKRSLTHGLGQKLGGIGASLARPRPGHVTPVWHGHGPVT
jgi:hypothetical protein